MADMYVRSQLIKTKRDDGNWHISIKNISDEEASLIASRPEVKSMFCYGVLNYMLDKVYTLGEKDAVICGSKEGYLTQIWSDTIPEGAFPQKPDEILVSANAKKELGLKVGSQVSIRDASGIEYPYTGLQQLFYGTIPQPPEYAQDNQRYQRTVPSVRQPGRGTVYALRYAWTK